MRDFFKKIFLRKRMWVYITGYVTREDYERCKKIFDRHKVDYRVQIDPKHPYAAAYRERTNDNEKYRYHYAIYVHRRDKSRCELWLGIVDPMRYFHC